MVAPREPAACVCDDWFVYLRTTDGSWRSYDSEYWPGWLDLPDDTDTSAGAVEEYVLPMLLALRPGRLVNATDEVPQEYWPSLEQRARSAS